MSVSLVFVAFTGLLTAALGTQGCSADNSQTRARTGVGTGTGAGGTNTGSGASDGTSGNGGDNGSGSFGDNGSTPPGSGQCVNLQCKQVACAAGQHTSVSGVVYDPAGKNPLYNVVVYVPNSQPAAFTDRATCDQCAGLYTGNPLVTTLTAPDGTFTLKDVPAGNDIPLVIQIGKWRRQITIPAVAQCTDNPLTDRNLTRLPANRGEGDLPKFAVSTGGSDSMECLFRRIGVDASEFAGGLGSGSERIHIYQGSGGNAAAGSPASTQLWSNEASLATYDIVVLSCEGDENAQTKPQLSLQAMQQYANAGGRIFASHFHYYWFNNGPSPFPSTATWTPGSQDIGDISGTIDQSFAKGIAFAQWMKTVNALNPDGSVAIQQARHNADVNPLIHKGSQPWIKSADGTGATQYFTFNTPLNAPEAQQCGRVVYSDLHVGAASTDYKTGTKSVPQGCSVQDLSPQEKALEFILFDLSSCVTPDDQPPAPPPVTPK